MYKRINLKSFFAGVIFSTLLISASTMAAPIMQSIQVSTSTVKKIILNGTDKTPTGDLQPFVYNDRTYVPLRYISENLYKNVGWDGNTGTITIDGINMSESDRNAIYAAIDLNYEHAQTENIEGYMGDISTSIATESLTMIRSSTQYLFELYDVSYSVKSKEITAYDGNTSEVRVVNEARKINGEGPYTNNKTTSLQKMIKENGIWKLSYSIVEKSEELI